VARLVTTWLPAFDAEVGQGGGLHDTLLGAARVMLATALTPQALGFTDRWTRHMGPRQIVM
jgi:hypothetical protein